MYGLKCFLLQNAMKAIIAAEKPIYDLTDGKLCKNRFLSAVRTQNVGTSVKILKSTENSTYIAKMNPDGSFSDDDFRILCTTDLHIDEDYELNNRTLQHLADRIADLKPDLVVLTGDCILSKYQQIDAIQFAKMMENIGVYWTYVFGNHEAREEKGSFKYQLYKSFIDSPYCLCKFGDKSLYGYGNFTVNIMSDENTIRKTLVFFDSGRYLQEPHRTNDGVPADLKGADYIKPSQIRWYEKEIASLKKQYGEDLKSMIYLHIPVPEYRDLFRQNEDGTFTPNENVKVLYGEMREPMGGSWFNSGLFDAMKRNGTEAIFCGHDHCNDFCAEYDGIYLVYNQTGGYNCYRLYDSKIMSPDESTWHYGVNTTDIAKDGSLKLEHCIHTQFNK